MDNPPHINVAICETFMVAWIEGHIFGHHQGQLCSCRAANRVWVWMKMCRLRYLHKSHSVKSIVDTDNANK